MGKRANPQFKRIEEAADQMWKALLMGNTFEIGAALSTDDPTTQAFLLLRKKHPEVLTSMLQSKSIVVTLGKSGTVSQGAWGTLEQAGYFPSSELPPDILFAKHAQFMRRNDVDPEQAVRDAQDASRAHNAIVIASK